MNHEEIEHCCNATLPFTDGIQDRPLVRFNLKSTVVYFLKRIENRIYEMESAMFSVISPTRVQNHRNSWYSWRFVSVLKETNRCDALPPHSRSTTYPNYPTQLGRYEKQSVHVQLPIAMADTISL